MNSIVDRVAGRVSPDNAHGRVRRPALRALKRVCDGLSIRAVGAILCAVGVHEEGAPRVEGLVHRLLDREVCEARVDLLHGEDLSSP